MFASHIHTHIDMCRHNRMTTIMNSYHTYTHTHTHRLIKFNWTGILVVALWGGVDLIYTSSMELITTYYSWMPRIGVDIVYWLTANAVLLYLRTMSNQFGNQKSVIINRDEVSEDIY